ncbi:MAG: TIGR01777 family protein [Deltaproteobacteria bacterium]|nr:TIGR01777 family protein [Deltaproteobacteria bacterium]
MKVLVTGSTGLIGSALVRDLTGEEHVVTRLMRPSSERGKDAVPWDPEKGTVDCNGLTGHDAVVHLAGENIAGSSWTSKRKVLIRDSRVRGTQLLCETLSRLERPPATFVCASAVGYYGDRGRELLREDNPPGKGFLSEVCREWEEATGEIARTGVRVVNLRIGMVLSPEGGALAKMLPAFRAGAGARIGSGEQYISWIALPDLVGVIRHALATDSLRGPVNAVAPHPVTNREFTKSLGHILRRPTVAFLPAFAARFFLGEMADELLLASTRAEPAKLLASGYKFRLPDLEGALRSLLGR